MVNVDYLHQLLSVACKGANGLVEMAIESAELSVAVLFVRSNYG